MSPRLIEKVPRLSPGNCKSASLHRADVAASETWNALTSSLHQTNQTVSKDHSASGHTAFQDVFLRALHDSATLGLFSPLWLYKQYSFAAPAQPINYAHICAPSLLLYPSISMSIMNHGFSLDTWHILTSYKGWDTQWTTKQLTGTMSMLQESGVRTCRIGC